MFVDIRQMRATRPTAKHPLTQNQLERGTRREGNLEPPGYLFPLRYVDKPHWANLYSARPRQFTMQG